MKKGFTLIEVILALMILSILFLAMGEVIRGLKTTKKVLGNYYYTQKENEILTKVLYGDILNATSIKVEHSKNLDYDRIYLTTSNSLYHLTEPYVLWYVSRNKNTLIRVESPFEIKLPSDKLFFLDKFKDGVTLFKLYRKKGKDLLVLKSDKPLYFEMIDKDLGVEKNETNGGKGGSSKKVSSSDKNSNYQNSSSSTSALPTF